jgi:hypothetical protein
MDVFFFLKQRTAFLRQFYETSATPFEERKKKDRGRRRALRAVL